MEKKVVRNHGRTNQRNHGHQGSRLDAWNQHSHHHGFDVGLYKQHRQKKHEAHESHKQDQETFNEPIGSRSKHPCPAGSNRESPQR